MKTGMLFSPVFARLQTASLTRLASPCLLRPSNNSPLEPSKFHTCNLFRFHTCGPSRKCGKQRTYRKPKSFRCNTCKKHRGRGVLRLTRNLTKDFYPEEHRNERSFLSSFPTKESILAGLRKSRDLTFLYVVTSLRRSFALPHLALDSIHRDSAHQLGIEIRRFLRHHFARRRDFHHLLDVARIQQKRNLRAPAVHGVQRRARFPLIGQVGFRRHRLRRNAQRGLQNSFVQQHHVQFALQRRNVRQQLRQVDPFAQRQYVERALLRLRCRISADRSLLARAHEPPEKLFLRFRFLLLAGKRERLRRKPRLEIAPHAAPRKIMNVRRHAVPRQYRQPFAPRIEKAHHGARGRRIGIDLSRVRGALLAVVQRRLVAVMPVGDHQLLVLHRFLDRRHSLRIRNHPQPVHHPVFIAHFRGRRGGRFGLRQNSINTPLRIGVQHEKLPRVHLRVPQQLQAVRLRPGKRVFVPEDDAGRILFQLSRADESPPRAAFFRSRHRIFLGVHIKRRSGILHDDIVANPIFDRRLCARVHIILRRVARIRPALLHGNQVVRVRGVILFLHRRRNLVVRLRQDAVERRALRVVAKGAERVNLSHEFSCLVLCRLLNLLFYANGLEFRKVRSINFSCEFDAGCAVSGEAQPYYNIRFMAAPKFSSARALIFDLDGTLIDSQRDLILSVNDMLQEMGREELHEVTISAYIGHGAPQLVRRALGGNAGDQECEQALQFFLAHYNEHKLDNTRAYPGVAEALEHLSAYPMAVLTNKPARVSVRILEGLGLAKYFRAVYGGNSFETKKPDPLGANTILREFAASPNEAILIGDSEVDVQTARNAGTLAAAVNYGFGTHDRAAYPADIYLDRLTDLAPLLGKSRE